MPELHDMKHGKGGYLTALAALLISLAISATAFVVLERIESAVREDVGYSVETVLAVTHNALEYWRLIQTKLIQHELKDTSVLHDLIAAQVQLYSTEGDLVQSQYLKELRRQLQPIIDEFGYQGFFVIAPDRVSIASMRNANIGTVNLLAKEGDFLQRVFTGETLFSNVVISDVPLPDKDGRLAEGQPTMFVATPVQGDSGEAIAVLTFRIAPAHDFGRIAQLGRIGDTGETYFFNHQGQIITESRFENQASDIGLLAPGESAVLHLELRDPGGDMTEGFRPTLPRHERPLTYGVSEALAGRKGVSLEGYRDYRGRLVLGAWRPPHDAQDLGVVTEIDKAEAYGIYNLTRRLLLATVGITVTLLLVLAATLAGGRQRALALAKRMTHRLRRSEQHFQHLANISHLMSRASGAESMMVTVVQEVRRIFGVDRAWLANPCDPAAASWRVPVESARQDCAGAVSSLMDIPMDAGTARIMREALASDEPVTFAPTSDGSPGCIHAKNTQAQMCIAVHPKVGQPWLLGLCHCSSERPWSDEEKLLLGEIGERVANAFTNLLLLDELEDALRERKNIMDTVPDVIVTLDPQGRIIDWNNSLEQATGRLPGELRRCPIQDIICEEDYGTVTAAIELCLQEGYTATEARLVKKGDGLVPFYWVAASRKDSEGNIVSISGSGRDITESKQAQEAVRRSEARLAQAQRIARLGNWEWDIESNNLYWSDEVYRIFGVSSDEFDATYEGFLERVHGDDLAAVEEAVSAALDRRGAYNMDHRIVLPDGSVRIVNEQGEVIYSELGNPVRMLGTAQDVTERKLAAEELRRHRDHLQEMVAEQTAGLKAAKEAAEWANQAKSEFLANMSHELRTPMHAILSFAGMGEDKVGKAPEEKLHHYFSRIRMSGERLLVLLNDLLDLSKLEAGCMIFTMEERDLLKVAEMVAAEFSGLLKSKSLTLEVLPSNVDTVAWFDADKILQVMRNLISNAVKFSPEGGRIQVAFEESTLPVGRRETDSESMPAIVVSIEDEGIGIPPEELESVFDKFVQSSKTKTGAGGTGLGLAICREIIEGHGGTIRAENVPGDGAVFVFAIPRKPKQEETATDAQ